MGKKNTLLKQLRTVAVIAALTLTAANTAAQSKYFGAVNSDGKMIYYEITSVKDPYAVEVTFWDGTKKYYYEGDINIPETVSYNGITYTVTGIGLEAFRLNGDLTSVTIPETITYIKNDAFIECHSLKSIFIPNTVTSIGTRAFGNCGAAESIKLPDSMTKIPASLLRNCESLKSIDIPEGVTEIGMNAFEGCKTPIYIAIPETVKVIQGGGFKWMTSLVSVTIPEGVTEINNKAFGYCESLKTVDYNAVSCITDAYSYTSPVFEESNGLTILNIGDKVTSIPDYMFKGCKFKEIRSRNAVAPVVSDNAFDDYTATLYVPKGSKSSYQSKGKWGNFNIVETDFSSIEETASETDGITAVISGEHLVISGADNSTPVNIYNPSGILVQSTTVATAADIDLPDGVLIISVAGKTFKVIK